MSGYTKKIAVIKQIKGGFSADGGSLGGLVRAESYAGFLKVEASLINFAPLTEGRYVFGMTDGLETILFEECAFEGECGISLESGFAFLVCFCNGSCSPIASAACGQMACALPDLREEMAKREKAASAPLTAESAKAEEPASKTAYDDEAIAAENYYEYNFDENGGAVRQDKAQKKEGRNRIENEEAARPVQGEKEQLKSDIGNARETAKEEPAEEPGLAGGYYDRMKKDIDSILSTYPREETLQAAMKGSRWARIDYAEDKYYVFGVLSVKGKPRYIGYGVPSDDPINPPPSLRDYAIYTRAGEGGFWIMYQDAETGVSVKVNPV